jgi:membrane-associated phospholipid phosphatase
MPQRPLTAVEPGVGARNGSLAIILFTVYLAAVGLAMIWSGRYPTPDQLIIAIGFAALALGRGRLFFRDWLPFLLLYLGWEALRGYADDLGAPVHSDDIIALERLLCFGIVPTVELQRLLHRADATSALDVISSLVYASHFIFALGVAFVFWLEDRRRYYQFTITLLSVALVGFVMFVLLPVAPPRFAYRHGEGLLVRDVIRDTLINLRMPFSFSWVYANLNPNDNAAFPSLHAAFPLLAWLFLRERNRIVGWTVAVYTTMVWFATVYLGHHYVVDVLGGAALALVANAVAQRSAIPKRPRLSAEVETESRVSRSQY